MFNTPYWGPPMTLNDPPACIMGNISDFVMKETDIYSDGLREKFRDFLKGHFFHLPEMTGSLKVYKLKEYSFFLVDLIAS